MDKNLEFIYEQRIKKTIKNLGNNNMEAFYVENEAEVIKKVQELISDDSTVAVGGSMTLFESGVIDLLRNGKYNFIDRYAEGLDSNGIKEVFRKSFFADAYLVSCNALTEDGELYCVDGIGNRVAAMIYGPDKVIVIVGVNKIVKDLQAAINRNKQISAPANNVRLNTNNPCTKIGSCVDCKNNNRLCNDFVVIRRQNEKDRIKVIIIGKELGY